jgi:hypothetical protein
MSSVIPKSRSDVIARGLEQIGLLSVLVPFSVLSPFMHVSLTNPVLVT